MRIILVQVYFGNQDSRRKTNVTDVIFTESLSLKKKDIEFGIKFLIF